MNPLFEKNLISTKEAGDLSGYAPDYLARLVRTEKIRGQRIGRAWFIEQDSLETFLEEQGNRKITHARSLSRVREKEYRAARSPVRRAAKIFTAPLPVPNLGVSSASLRTQLVAVSVALLVVTGSAFVAEAQTLPNFGNHFLALANETAVGFRATFGDIPSRIAAHLTNASSVIDENRIRVGSEIASATQQAAPQFLVTPNLSSMRMALADDQGNSPAVAEATSHVSVQAPTITLASIQDSAQASLAFVTSPSSIGRALVDAYASFGTYGYEAIRAVQHAELSGIEATGVHALAFGTYVRDAFAASPRAISVMNLVIGQSVIDAAHVAVAAEVSLAFGTARTAPIAARTTVALVGTVGDALVHAAGATPALAVGVFKDITSVPAYAAPRVADAAWKAEYAIAARFIKGTNVLSEQYLALVEDTGAVTYVGAHGALALVHGAAPAVAIAPKVIENAYLGVLGKTALALDDLTHRFGQTSYGKPIVATLVRGGNEVAAVAAATQPALSAGEQVALTTYETIHGWFSSANNALAVLFAPPPEIVLSSFTAPHALTHATTTPPVQPTRSVAVTNYPTYTTVVRGVTQSSLDDALAVMRANILNQVSGMIQPVSHQVATNVTTIQQVNMIQDLSNLIVHNGDFRGGTFDGGSLTHGIAVTATTGTFTNLIAQATSLATTTITGDLSVSGTITPAIISAGTSISAPYFVATSSTATSTFAGSLAVGTSTQFANGLFAVGTSSPLLYVDSNTGRIGVGTSTPAVAFDVYATDAIRLPVGTSAQRPGTGDVGYVRFNTTTHQFEGYGDNGVWQGLGGVIDANQDTYITADTNNTNEDFLRFFNHGTQTATFTNQGLVGIASTSPFAQLSVQLMPYASTTVAFAIGSSTSAYATSTLFTVDNAGNVTEGATNATTTIAGGFAAANNKFNVLSGGNVGIGTTSPQALLTLSNSGATDLLFTDTSQGGSYRNYLIRNSGANLYLGRIDEAVSSFVPYLTLQNGGNIGIGTTTPQTSLAVAYSDNSFKRGLTITNTNNGNDSISGIALTDSTGAYKGIFDYLGSNYNNASLANSVILGTPDNTKLGFIGGTGSGTPDLYFQSGWNSTPAIYVKGSTQKVGIGTTTPAVAFDIYATDAMRLPVGTSAQRPSTGDVGYVRYNLSTHQFEGFGDNAVWQGLGGVIDANQDTKITADTNNTNEDYLRFFTEGTQNMTLTNQGLLGVGSTSPFAQLGIQLMPYASSTIAFAIGSSTSAYATTTLFVVNNQGHVGIGTGAPSHPLDIVASANSSPALTLYDSGGSESLSLYAATSSLNNVFIGKNVATTNRTGADNVALGASALASNVDGSQNIAIGSSALAASNGSLSNNVAVGYYALKNAKGLAAQNTAVGSYALYNHTYGSYNAAFGYGANYRNTDATSTTAIGYGAGYGGPFAGYHNQGGTYVGYQSGYSVDTGSDYNTLLGYNSGYDITTGANNIVLGTEQSTGSGVTTGSGNILIGTGVRYGLDGTASNQLNIGNLIFATGLGSENTLSTGNVGIGTTSPTYKLSVEGISSLGNQAIAGYFTATTSAASQFPYASTTQLSAYGSVAVGSTATSTIAGDYGASSIRGSLGVYGNTTSGAASALTLQRGSTNGDNALTFNDQTGSPLLKLYTSANTAHAYLTGYQSFLDLGTSVGGTALSIDTSNNVNATANLVPTANQTYNLGAPADYWNNAYINNILTNNLTAASTSISGTNQQSFTVDAQNASSDAHDISLIFYRGAGASSNGVLSWDSTNKRFNLNQNTYIYNPNSGVASTTLAVRGVASQTGPLQTWLDGLGNELARVSAAGNFGIGTNTPSQALSVAGNGLFSGTLTASGFTVGTLAATSSASAPYFAATDTAATSTFAGGLTVGTNQLLVQHATGNVGIGTTSPSQALAVQGNGLFSGNLSAANIVATGTLSVAGNTTLANATSTSLYTSTLGLGSGNYFTSLLGNALTNVGGVLTVSTSSLASGFFLNGGNSFGAAATLGTNDANSLSFKTNGTTRLTLAADGSEFNPTADGTLKIGTTTARVGEVNIASANGTGGINLWSAYTDATNYKKDTLSVQPATLAGASNNVLTLKTDKAGGANYDDIQLLAGTGNNGFFLNSSGQAGIGYVYSSSDATAPTLAVSGKTAIGSTTANAMLDVSAYGRNQSGTGASGAGIAIENTDTGSSATRLGFITGSGSNWFAGTDSSANGGDNFFIATSTGPGAPIAFQVNGEGSIGIANTGAAPVTPANKLYSLGGALYWNTTQLTNGTAVDYWNRASGLVSLQTITDKLGIGTSSPLAKLDVAGDNNGTSPLFQVSSVASYATTTQFIINSAGNVGIGTSSPSTQLLEIESSSNAALGINGDGVNAVLNLRQNSTNRWAVYNNATDGAFSIWNYKDNSRPFTIASTTGNVGIGTTTPGTALDVWGTMRGKTLLVDNQTSDASLIFQNNGVYNSIITGTATAGGWITGSSAGALGIRNQGVGIDFSANSGGSVQMHIAASGNVGIGTTSPQDLLDVVKNSNGNVFARVANPNAGTAALGGFQVSNTDLSSGGAQASLAMLGSSYATNGVLVANRGLLDIGNASAGGAIGTSGSNAPLVFFTNGYSNERMRIDGSGNVGIGTASPVSKLEVDPGTVTTAGAWASTAFGIKNSTSLGSYSQIGFGWDGGGGASTYAAAYMGYLSTYSGGAGYGDLVFGTRSSGSDVQPTERMRIDSSGNVGIGTSPGTWRLNVQGPSGGGMLNVNDSAGGQQFALVAGQTGGGGWNTAGTVEYISKNTSTGRSINAAGTINASGADYAEYFYQQSPGSLTSGELVGLNPATGKVEAAKAGSQLVGVVSTQPGFVGNDLYDANNPGNTALIGLTGQLPTKVSSEGGPINIGDSLAASSVAGVAKKAEPGEPSIGIAMSAFTGSGTGIVTLLLHTAGNTASTTQSVQNVATINATTTTTDLLNAGVANIGSLALTGGITFADGSSLTSAPNFANFVSTSTLATTLTGYAQLSAIPSIANLVSTSTLASSLAAYATTASVNAALAQATSSLASAASLASATSSIASLSSSLSNLSATTTSLISQLAALQTQVNNIATSTVNLSGYVTTSGLASAIAPFVSTTTLATTLSSYAKLTDLSSTTLTSLQGSVTGDIIPNTDGAYTLGTRALRFTNIYAQNINAGDLTFTETTSAQSGSNLATGTPIALFVTQATAGGTTHTVPVDFPTALNNVLYGSNNLFFNTTGKIGFGVGSSTPSQLSGFVTLQKSNPSGATTDYRLLTLQNTDPAAPAVPYSFSVVGGAGGGDLTLSSNDTASSTRTNTSLPVWQLGLNGATDSFAINRAAAGTGSFTATNLFKIASSGNVGIASSTPFGLLSINPNALASGVPSFVIGSSTATNFIVTQSGNVGIGTTSPSYKLDVQGTGLTYAQVKSTNGGETGLQLANTTSGAWDMYMPSSSSDLRFYTSASGAGDRLTITSAGNVGIGTTTPGANLNIVGDTGIKISNAALSSNTFIAPIASPSYGTLIKNGGGTGVAFFDNSYSGVAIGSGYAGTYAAPSNGAIIQGNVGIGTSTPNELLTVGYGSEALSGTNMSVGNTSGNSGLIVGQAPGRNLVSRWVYNATPSSALAQIYTGGYANQLQIDGSSLALNASSGGNVGIGTTSPGASLHVYGNYTAQTSVAQIIESSSGNGYSGGLAFNVNPSGGGHYTAGYIMGENVNNAGATDGGKLSLWTAATDGSYTLTRRLTVDGSGNVGIGTASPTVPLQVEKDTGTGESTLNIVNATDGTGSAARINLAGGSNGGNSELTITQYAPSHTGSLLGVSSAGVSAIFENSAPGYGTGLAIGTSAAHPLTLGTSNTARMTIDSSGRVLIGQTSSEPSSAYLQTSHANNGNWGEIGYGFIGAPTDGGYPYFGYNFVGSGSGTFTRAYADYTAAIQFASGGTIQTYTGGTAIAGSSISFTSGPYVALGGNSWTTSSDERLKTNITPLNDAQTLSALETLTPITYNWKDVHANAIAGQQLGFTAQNVQSVFPQLIGSNGTTTITLADGTKQTITHTLGVNYAGLVVPAIAAIRELDARTNWIGVASSTATTTVASPVFTLNAATGNIGIGMNDPQHTLQVAGEVGAIAFVNTSTRSAKDDIQYLTPEQASSTLDKLMQLKAATYHYKIENQNDPLRLGFIAEDADQIAPEIASNDGKGIDIYKLATFTLTGVQQLALRQQALTARVDDLSARLTKLENGSVSSASGSPFSVASVTDALAAVGVTFKDGVTTIANLVAAQFTVGSSAKPSGITLYDQTTGAPYCVSVTGGKMVSTSGACDGSTATSTPSFSGTSAGSSSLTLLGDNPVHVSVGAAFTEPGVVAQDAKGNTDPIEVFVNGIDVGTSTPSLDTSSPTTYLITYRMIDSTGKTLTAMRSVIVGNPDGTVTLPSSSSTGTTAPVTSGSSGTASSTPVSTDTTPPVVTLNGAAAIQLTAGDTFIDPGATASDNVDGTLTKKIVETGSVDTATAGLYTLTYGATDAAGNTGSVSRVVTVIVASPVTATATTTATTTTASSTVPVITASSTAPSAS